jgi:tellurite resistance-related uncharacterized protein
MSESIPTDAVKYSQSPVFTQDTIPDALVHDHQTKVGVWGRIVVHEGALIYVRNEKPAQKIIAGASATIWPDEPHKVTPYGNVTFQVEFFRIPKQEVAQ